MVCTHKAVAFLEAGAQHVGGSMEAAQEVDDDFYKRNKQYRDDSAQWVDGDPEANLLIMRQCIEPQVQLVGGLMKRAADSYKTQRLQEIGAAVKNKTAQPGPKFRLLDAYNGELTTQYMADISDLLQDPTHWNVLPPKSKTRANGTKVYKTLSRGGSVVHAMADKNLNYPFKLLVSPFDTQARDEVRRDRSCRYCRFTRRHVKRFGRKNLGSRQSMEDLIGVLEVADDTIAQLESKHASDRREANSRSLQSKTATLEALSAASLRRIKQRQRKARWYAASLPAEEQLKRGIVKKLRKPAKAEVRAKAQAKSKQEPGKKRGGSGGRYKVWMHENSGGSFKGREKELTAKYWQMVEAGGETLKYYEDLGKLVTKAGQSGDNHVFGRKKRRPNLRKSQFVHGKTAALSMMPAQALLALPQPPAEPVVPILALEDGALPEPSEAAAPPDGEVEALAVFDTKSSILQEELENLGTEMRMSQLAVISERKQENAALMVKDNDVQSAAVVAVFDDKKAPLSYDVYQHRPRLPNATVHIDVEGPEIAIAGATVEALCHLGKVPSTGGRARQAFDLTYRSRLIRHSECRPLKKRLKKEKPCVQAGYCVCRKKGRYTKALHDRLTDRYLRPIVPKKSAKRRLVHGGDVVMRLTVSDSSTPSAVASASGQPGVSGAEPSEPPLAEPDVRWWHIAKCDLKKMVPAFVLLRPGQHRVAPGHIALQPQFDGARLANRTMWEALRTIDVKQRVEVRTHVLQYVEEPVGVVQPTELTVAALDGQDVMLWKGMRNENLSKAQPKAKAKSKRKGGDSNDSADEADEEDNSSSSSDVPERSSKSSSSSSSKGSGHGGGRRRRRSKSGSEASTPSSSNSGSEGGGGGGGGLEKAWERVHRRLRRRRRRSKSGEGSGSKSDSSKSGTSSRARKSSSSSSSSGKKKEKSKSSSSCSSSSSGSGKSKRKSSSSSSGRGCAQMHLFIEVDTSPITSMIYIFIYMNICVFIFLFLDMKVHSHVHGHVCVKHI